MKHKRRREGEVIIDLSNVSPSLGQWWSVPNVIQQVLNFLPSRKVIENKTVCKHWFKVMNHQFVRGYVANCLRLSDEKLESLEVMMNGFKTEKKMTCSYEGVLDQLKELENSDTDYSESVRSLLSDYDKSHSIEILKKIAELTENQVNNLDSLCLTPPKIKIDDIEYDCKNYSSIHSILLSKEENSVEQRGLDVTTVERSYFVILDNGYPIKIDYDFESGRYDGHYIIKINGVKLIDLSWYEGGYEADHNSNFIKTFNKVLDFQSSSPVENRNTFTTLLFAWLSQLFPEAKSYEIPDSCFGEEILSFVDLNEDDSGSEISDYGRGSFSD